MLKALAIVLDLAALRNGKLLIEVQPDLVLYLGSSFDSTPKSTSTR
jgi:hypothetical protein